MTRIFKILLTTLTALMLSLTLAGPAEAERGRHIKKGVRVATHQVGDWYQYGAAGPHRFDCSGLVYYSYRKVGIKMPRTSRQQAASVKRIPRRKMRRGDLMFFHNSSGRVYHVAIFLRWKNGRRLMLEAARPGTRVHRTVPWSNRWFAGSARDRYYKGRR